VTGDPSNPSTTLNLLKGMKWLLANMSKGRNVSDFFPHVVKLVGAPNLEVRKMVYIYLARYANHDHSCRELALLSINAFQRGLADREPLLRSLALRVLTCMDVPDVLQLQILGVRTCCKDSSPYVRKCAANAVGKLHPRCLAAGDGVQADQLVDIVTKLLEEDGSTMVLTSAMIAFSEICPQRLEVLHGCYRKVCHLLTDMDEWGQVVVMDALMQYCRTFFKQPRGQKKGSAERIDQERRVTRSTRRTGPADRGAAEGGSMSNIGGTQNDGTLLSLDDTTSNITNGASSEAPALPPRQKQKVKRRVVRKAFYSDEEDESSEEEVSPNYPITGGNVAGTLRERPLLGTPSATGNTFFRDDVNAATEGVKSFDWKTNNNDAALTVADDDEDSDLDEDHKLLLQSSLPLLKSRNSAVVLAACSLHYHCGVASIKTRSALGKALVRIHRDRREIQYIVLVSVRTLVRECPSAFSPFLNDFFVKGMDPSFTRMIKLDILVSLCHDPKAIEAVLTELRTYVRHSDKSFSCAAIRAVGKVAELARVVYDRRAYMTGEVDAASARADSNVIALNCLSGLVTLSEFSRNDEVVGECAATMQRILSQLLSDDGITSAVNDPAGIQERALKRLLLILLRSLHSHDSDDDEDKRSEETQLELKSVSVPNSAVASILWVIGEWLTMSVSVLASWKMDEKSKKKIRMEVLRLLVKSFTGLDPQIKLQAVHLASKVLLALKSDVVSSSDTTKKECAISELILAMARVDVLQDVRDRARYESNILHMSIGLSNDTSSLQQLPPGAASVTVNTAKSMLLNRKPNASSLPLDSKEFGSAKQEEDLFRFGTLNNILCNRSTGCASPLPKWADTDSPSDLRDPSAVSKLDLNGEEGGLYSSSSEEESSSSSSDGSSSSSGSDSSDESEDDSSDSESSSSIEDSDVDNAVVGNGGFDATPIMDPPVKSEAMVPPLISNESEDESSSDSSGDDSDESSESDDDDATDKGKTNADTNMKPAVGTILDMETANNLAQIPQYDKQTSSSSSVAAGLEDLVMAPLVANKDNIAKPSSIDDESGVWKEFVRPELSGGLFVKMRFVHGRSRAKEARVLGLDPKNPSTVCLQVHVENLRTDAGTLRHVRIIQRGGTSGGSISPSKVITPPEFPALKTGMASTVFIGITFATATDRDGVAVAKFDVKSDRGTTSIEIRPTLGELLNDDETETMSQTEFDAVISGLQGIQRISMTFTLSPMNEASFKDLPRTILQHLNMKQIGKWTGKVSFVGTLPASGQKVYVVVKCDSVTGYGDIVVCSHDAMAANSIMNLLKQALAS